MRSDLLVGPRAIGVVFLVVGVAASPVAAEGPVVPSGSFDLHASLPKALVGDSSRRFGVRPPQVAYTGDGTGYVGRHPWRSNRGYLTWRSWNQTSAYGVGTVWIKRCNPSCAEGRFRAYRGSIRFKSPRNGRFRILTVRHPYKGEMITDTRRLRRISTYWRWM